MAYERKVLRIAAEFEEICIQEFEYFGWELESSQDCYEEYEQVEYDIAFQPWLVSYSNSYVKLILKRNTSMKHYDELVELENKYFADKQMSMDYDEKAKFGGGFIALIVFSFLFALVCLVVNIIGTIIFAAIGILIIVLRKKACKKNQEIADWALDEMAHCILDAEDLLK